MKEKIGYLEFAIELAKRAGAIQMENYHKAHSVEWYDRQQFRSEVDVAIAKLVREEIMREFPKHNIMSEELPEKIGSSDFTWVVDELDGTGPYLRGTTDHFSFSIALCFGKKPVLGIINAPKRKELFSAITRGGAVCNGKPIHINTTSDINKVWMGVDSGKFKRGAHLPYMSRALESDGISCPLQSGCASVPLCQVADGKIDAYLATSLNPEDVAAAVIINLEAGAKVTNLNGEKWQLGDCSILAANPILHQKLSEFFNIGGTR